MITYSLILILSCGGETTPTPASAPLTPKPPAKVTAAAAAGALKAERRPEDGWGAIFWRQATAWKVGGGSVVVGPREASQVRTSGEALTCDGVASKGAPKNGAIALPEGAKVPTVVATPAIQAHRVERAAWRLDEVLPPRGRCASKVTSNSPSLQRGVEVGSVTKTRRHGAPPFLIATGVRSCAGVVAFTDLKAEKTLAYDSISSSCEPLRVLPAQDYDGDGKREFAVFSDERVVIYRVDEGPGLLSMTRLSDFACKVTN